VGLDYSFEFLAPRSGATVLLEALAGRISGGYARALRAALPWAPQTPGRGDAGIRGLRAVFDIQNYYDLVVTVGIDEEVRRYFADSNRRIADHTVGGKAEVGLVYMKMYAGEAYVRLTLTAATTGMSMMLACSQEVRKVMLALARAGQTRALFLDDEQDATWDLLHPLPRGSHWRHEVPRLPRERLDRPGEVDAYCELSLELAGLG
jgi:hypothetical protein